MSRPDAIVVGAGVVGAAVAYWLTLDGLRVDVIDAAFPGAGATSAGMGHVVVMDDSPAQLALTAYSRTLLDGLGALPASCEVDPCGTLWLAADDDEYLALRDKQAVHARAGVATELLDAAALREAEPELRRDVRGALRVKDDVVLYPPAFARWLLAEAGSRGARVVHAHVDRIVDEGVAYDGVVHNADVVVNAAGARAPLLTPALPIVPRRGHLVITDRYPGFCRHQLVELGYLKSAHTLDGASVAFNVQPRTTGQLLVGSSREMVGWDARIDHAVVRAMLARARAWLPRIGELRAIRTWTGFRPATPDKLPYIGAWPGTTGQWVAAGHEGLGITTALATGRILADLVAGRAPAIDAQPFALERLHEDVPA
ncbi:MAG TPA: FAD-dependent oxidoreductase [Longimicrobiales bacterium]|nr:FAD-dependent oxidoreductase [Longimicrobiales bacterium]